MVGEGQDRVDLPRQEVILRDATADDEAALGSLDLGTAASSWFEEVSEIVAGLLAWRDDRASQRLARQVVVAEIEDEVVAVAAHECVEHERVGPLADHRYLMVVAVRADHQRGGVARMLTESLFAAMQSSGAQTVQWLVHPENLASTGFSRSVFPEADETYPPEDRPYIKFVLAL